MHHPSCACTDVCNLFRGVVVEVLLVGRFFWNNKERDFENDVTNKSTLSHVLEWYRDLPSLMKSSSKEIYPAKLNC